VLVWIGFARHFGMDGPYSALVNVAACGLPMVAWSLLIDKVHRTPSTGIDWSARQPLRDTPDLSLTKLAGLWVTWTAIAVIYGTGRFYGSAISRSRCGASPTPRRSGSWRRYPMCCGSVRATLQMGAVSGVYFWRAKTEERHLKLDPDYRAYSAWMTRNGFVPRLFARLRG
jgi:hypothetical protein